MDTAPALLDSVGLKITDLKRCQDAFIRLWRKHNFKVKIFQEGSGMCCTYLGLPNEKISTSKKSGMLRY
jgi:hypothetical protein